MAIIRSIEIKYFRSSYSVRVPVLEDVNIFSGKNDVGKSNVLKALNLFFNGQTDWQANLDFYADFSQKRLEIVRADTVKGKQFISIEIEFNRPTNYSGSLPETFKVKRTWQRNSLNYTESNNLDSLDKTGKLLGKVGIARQFLPQFLNRIRYEYVPAVKDRLYHEHLLTRLQKTLLNIRTDADSRISETANDLAAYIQEKIVDLSGDFERATNISSSIIPPAEFAELFQAFVVSTNDGMSLIPLTYRGDGIQARYVSSVLRYINTKSSDFFIWGFEEPENSLEYSKAIELADDFVHIYSRDAQIFLTTHSPAFTSLQEKNTTCYRAYKEEQSTFIVNLWPQEINYKEREKLIEELGVMKLQEEMHRQFLLQKEEITKANEVARTLENEIATHTKPLVLVSGKTDKALLELAWAKLNPKKECPFLVRSVAETNDPKLSIGGDGQLAKTIETIHPEDKRKVIALFDRDKAGQEYFKKLPAYFVQSKKAEVAVHRNGFSFAFLLQTPAGREDYAAAENLCIEFLFTDSDLEVKSKSGKQLRFQKLEVADSIPLKGGHKVSATVLPNIELPECYRKPKDEDKIIFANEIAPELPPAAFEGFRPTLDLIKKILDGKI